MNPTSLKTDGPRGFTAITALLAAKRRCALAANNTSNSIAGKEVLLAVVWLLSADSSYTTGTLLDVTGGR